MRVFGRGLASVAVLTLAMVGLTAVPASADTGDDNGITYTYDPGDPTAGAVATEYDHVGSSGTVTIPDTVTFGSVAYDVVGIGDDAFRFGTVTDVTIGGNVVSIGVQAFSNQSLSDLTIPDSVVNIGIKAFEFNHLADLTLGVNVATIGASAFNDNELATLTIPDSVTSIAQGAFDSNELTSLTLGNGIVTIGIIAFQHNQLSSLTIPDSVIDIGGQAFAENELTSLTLGDNVETIGLRAFEDNQLTSVTLPSTVTLIENYAFNNNPDLESVVFTGPAPTVTSAMGTTHVPGSFGDASGPLILSYPWRFGLAQTSGGYDTPSWRNYATQAIATVDFNLNGQPGTAPADEDVVVDDTVTEPAEPTASGYTFTGWFTDVDGTAPFDFTMPITEDITLYAGWEEQPAYVTVSKTVDASFVRVYDWDLDKTGDVAGITVRDDAASAEVDYTVTATPGDYRDDYYVLSGQITVTSEIVESLPFTVIDTPDVGADATCEVFTVDGEPAEDVTIGAQETVTFDYTCELDGTPDDGTNTATVTSFDGKEVSVTEGVVFDQRDTSFESITVVDDQTTTDDGWEVLGEAGWNADGIPTEFTYTLTHDDLAIGECTSFTNTALINETERSTQETVEICPEAGATPAPTPTPEPAPEPEPEPTLSKTGADMTGGTIAALLLLVTGGLALTLRRRQQS